MTSTEYRTARDANIREFVRELSELCRRREIFVDADGGRLFAVPGCCGEYARGRYEILLTDWEDQSTRIEWRLNR